MAEDLRRLFSIRNEIDQQLERLARRGTRDADQASHADALLEHGERQYLVAAVEQLRRFFELYGFQNAITGASRIIEKRSVLTHTDAKRRLDDLWDDFMRDCDLRHVEIIGADLFKYYDVGFGHDVTHKFPEATTEIKEAGTCYALGRHTASVFHLMRAVEHGLRALAVAVGVPGAPLPLEYQEWHGLIDQVHSRSSSVIDAWGRSAELTNARQFFKRIIADLQSFKDDVRNVTMHTRTSYDGPGALSVNNRTRDWFQVLSTKVSEDQIGSILDRTAFKP